MEVQKIHRTFKFNSSNFQIQITSTLHSIPFTFFIFVTSTLYSFISNTLNHQAECGGVFLLPWESFLLTELVIKELIFKFFFRIAQRVCWPQMYSTKLVLKMAYFFFKWSLRCWKQLLVKVSLQNLHENGPFLWCIESEMFH